MAEFRYRFERALVAFRRVADGAARTLAAKRLRLDGARRDVAFATEMRRSLRTSVALDAWALADLDAWSVVQARRIALASERTGRCERAFRDAAAREATARRRVDAFDRARERALSDHRRAEAMCDERDLDEANGAIRAIAAFARGHDA